MKSSEFRVGNIIHVLHEDFVTEKIVDAHTIALMEDYERDPNDEKWSRGGIPEMYSEIPLTEEWLKNFGFEKNRDFDSFRIAISPLIKWACRTFIVVAIGRKYWDGEGWMDLISERADHDYPELQTCTIPCKYVHQLQNLYFALTGEELQLAEQKQP
jgi:hypothetical protein